MMNGNHWYCCIMVLFSVLRHTYNAIFKTLLFLLIKKSNQQYVLIEIYVKKQRLHLLKILFLREEYDKGDKSGFFICTYLFCYKTRT